MGVIEITGNNYFVVTKLQFYWNKNEDTLDIWISDHKLQELKTMKNQKS